MFDLRLERTNLAANDEAHSFESAIEKEAILNQIGRGRVVLVLGFPPFPPQLVPTHSHNKKIV